MGSRVRPSEAGAVTTAVAGVPAVYGQLAVMAVPGISQEEHEREVKRVEDFDAACARANYVILTSIDQKDIIALALLPTLAAKWKKL